MIKFNEKGQLVVMTEEEIAEKKRKDEEYRQTRRPNYGVIQDTMDAVLNHADGKIYDSKSAYRRALKEQGYIEVGNEWKDPEKRRKQESFSEMKKREEAWDKAIEQALAKHGIY